LKIEITEETISLKLNTKIPPKLLDADRKHFAQNLTLNLNMKIPPTLLDRKHFPKN
jgi:hypothetical protein